MLLRKSATNHDHKENGNTAADYYPQNAFLKKNSLLLARNHTLDINIYGNMRVMLLLLYLREFLVLCSAQIVLEAYAQRLCGLIGLAVNFEEEFL